MKNSVACVITQNNIPPIPRLLGKQGAVRFDQARYILHLVTVDTQSPPQAFIGCRQGWVHFKFLEGGREGEELIQREPLFSINLDDGIFSTLPVLRVYS